MSKLGLVIVMMLMVGRINAQNYPAPGNDPLTYFVLIQAQDGQAFYVRLNDKLYSSSPAGHLILSQLKDSAYPITVGFPGQSFPEQRYLLNPHEKDRFLRLARQSDQWRLLDEQEQPLVTVADPGAAERPLLAGVKKDDAFSQLMSAIVQDTVVMYSTYAAASPDSTQPATLSPARGRPDNASTVKADTAMTAKADTAATTSSNSTSGSSNPAPAATVIPSAPTGVVKLSEFKSTQSLIMVFTDHPTDKMTDTIDVNIPIDSAVTRRPSHHSPSPDTPRSAVTRHPQPADTTRSAVTRHPQPLDTTRSAVTRHPQPADTTRSTPATGKPDTSTLTTGAPHKSAIPFINSDCHASATDYDVDKLRIHMLAAAKDDDRIQAAYKVFKTKCFTTRQVRALSEVFTTDAAKFKFLATAYPFVSDDQFPELTNLFSDSVYTGKFQTLIERH